MLPGIFFSNIDDLAQGKGCPGFESRQKFASDQAGNMQENIKKEKTQINWKLCLLILILENMDPRTQAWMPPGEYFLQIVAPIKKGQRS